MKGQKNDARHCHLTKSKPTYVCLSQLQMAKKIHITQADLSKMENGKRSIGKTIAKRIEKIFGVNYRYSNSR